METKGKGREVGETKGERVAAWKIIFQFSRPVFEFWLPVWGKVSLLQLTYFTYLCAK